MLNRGCKCHQHGETSDHREHMYTSEWSPLGNFQEDLIWEDAHWNMRGTNQ